MSETPLNALKEIDGEYPHELSQEMNQPDFLLPEPFYGPFEEDMKEDLLLLLMNPGLVKYQEQYAPTINKSTIERYTSWNRDNFLKECGRLDTKYKTIPRKRKICEKNCVLHDLAFDGCRWRRTRYREAKFKVKLSFDLINTMEYIPYHSKNYNDLSSIHSWMHEAKTTELAFNAVCEIAKNHLVKYLVGLGGAWIEIFNSHGHTPVENITVRSEKGKALGSLLKYQITDSALPVVIHLVQRQVKLPVRPSVVNEFRRMLGEPKLSGVVHNDVITNNI